MGKIVPYEANRTPRRSRSKPGRLRAAYHRFRFRWRIGIRPSIPWRKGAVVLLIVAAISAVSVFRVETRQVYDSLVHLASGGSGSLAGPTVIDGNWTVGPNEIAGAASIIDGDTIDVRGIRIRLHGIDSPERDQTCRDIDGATWSCGREATRALRHRIAGGRVTCDRRDIDRYDRVVSVCWLDGQDLNAWMVENGWAVAYTYYTWRYVPEEAIARLNSAGIWRGAFMEPYRWRQLH